jgi:ribosomal protein L37AE/L43A
MKCKGEIDIPNKEGVVNNELWYHEKCLLILQGKAPACGGVDGRQAYHVPKYDLSKPCAYCNKIPEKGFWVVWQQHKTSAKVFCCCTGHFVAWVEEEVKKAGTGVTNCYQCDRRFTNAAYNYPSWFNGKETLFFCDDDGCKDEYKAEFLSYPCHQKAPSLWCDYKGSYKGKQNGDFMGHTCLPPVPALRCGYFPCGKIITGQHIVLGEAGGDVPFCSSQCKDEYQKNKVGSMTISTTPEEKAAAVERSKQGFSKWHCFACGRNLDRELHSNYPTVQTSLAAQPHELLGTVYFCTEGCKDEWSHRQDAAAPKEEKRADQIRPDYYQPDNVYEPFKIIRHYGLNFFEGNVLKYLLRAGKKSSATRLEDLQQAATYLASEIELEKQKGK